MVIEEMVPPDGLCNYIYYTSVVVSKGNIYAIEGTRSWNVFQNALSTFKKTSGGIGFDVRYVTVQDLDATLDSKWLKNLTSRNVKHYGVLNVLETSAKVKGVFGKAKDLLKQMKTLQGSDGNRRTLIAMGIYNYHEKDAWSNLQEMFTEAVEQSVADTVIAYSSVGWIQSESECLSVPPSVWDKSVFLEDSAKNADRVPDIQTVVGMMKKDRKIKEGIRIGFSFELATLAYILLKLDAANPYKNINAPCSRMFLTDLSQLECRAGNALDWIHITHVGSSTAILMADDAFSLEKKCEELSKSSTSLRQDVSVLLLNAHLGDFSKNGKCSKEKHEDRKDPFYRIRAVKTKLKIP
ncbi:uncharacterized protein LOC142774249 [Rhipicephalus microplus]|uniref:uncharacterized protein LOC142774249 n=1 Tax=Rhipicephalus microplus TaxID=6941 RepID=UPI003F6BA07C